MKVIITENAEEMSKKAAEIYEERIRNKPDIVLGLATGGTPEKMYAILARKCLEEGLDFSNVKTFNLDEYLGLAPDHDQSYRCFMNMKFFNDLNIDTINTRVLDGLAEDPEAECRKFEEEIKKAGGIDLQLLGVGQNGHIAFNEPGSAIDSRTRVVELAESTIEANSRFFNDKKEVPTKALSMGIGSIKEVGEIVLVANGANKTEAIAKTLEGPVTEDVPASLIRDHDSITFIIDKEAASKLEKAYS